MIVNATLSRIDTPSGATPAGGVTYATGAAVSVRCALTEPTYAQRYTLGAAIESATAVLYVPRAAVAAVAQGQRVVVAVDGSAARTYRVVHVREWVKAGGLSHWEAFLQTE